MPNLLLCLTPGSSLSDWRRLGILPRELAIYRRYLDDGFRIRVLTFDDDGAAAMDLPAGLSPARYPSAALLPGLAVLGRNHLGWADVIKTNQAAHAWYYVAAARAHRKPLLLRCGYLRGERRETLEEGRPSLKLRALHLLEGRAFRFATLGQVPTEELADYVRTRYRVPAERVRVVPNYVDAERFAPRPGITAEPRSVIAVARLAPEKRLELLVEACALAGASRLTLIGAGPERAAVARRAEARGLTVTFLGVIENARLPEHYARATVYALVSRWEGHPKALLEAMACGRPCLVADAPGSRGTIRHGETGLIAAPNPRELAAGLDTLFEEAHLRTRLGDAARAEVTARLTPGRVYAAERENIDRLLARKGR